MTKRGPTFFAELVAAIAETGSIANAARLCRCSTSAVWGWLSASANGEPGFDVEFLGEVMPLHLAAKQAQRVVSATILDNFRYRLLHGTDEPAKFQGRQVYKTDPALALLSDQDLEDLGITTRYLRDSNGQFIPEVIHHEPPIAGVLAYLAAEYPRQFGNKVEINQQTTLTTGVKVVPRLAKPSTRPIAIEAPADVEPDDLSDILGYESEPAPMLAFEPPTPVVPVELPPSEPVMTPPKPHSDLTRDLLTRLAQRAGADRAPPVVPVGRPEADDDDPRRVGSGSVPPGAMKLV